MFHMVSLDPIDYLAIGHITVDVTPSGLALGGSALYAALTARAMGLRVGVVTVRGNEVPLVGLEGITIVATEAEHSTTFENVYTSSGRDQYIRHVAPKIDYAIVPEAWKRARIIHLAPVAQEVISSLPPDFHPAFLGLTPQGWMRNWDDGGRVFSCSWEAPGEVISQAGAVVFSADDVDHSEEVIESLAQSTRVLAVTEGSAGARLYWHGDNRRFRAPAVIEVDPTGAGDIFSAAFFARLINTRDPWEAARFANCMAALSVTRVGLAGVPSVDEVKSCQIEVFG